MPFTRDGAVDLEVEDAKVTSANGPDHVTITCLADPRSPAVQKVPSQPELRLEIRLVLFVGRLGCGAGNRALFLEKRVIRIHSAEWERYGDFTLPPARGSAQEPRARESEARPTYHRDFLGTDVGRYESVCGSRIALPMFDADGGRPPSFGIRSGLGTNPRNTTGRIGSAAPVPRRTYPASRGSPAVQDLAGTAL